MTEPLIPTLQVFSFGMAAPDLKLVGQSEPEAPAATDPPAEAPLPVVITPLDEPVAAVEPEPEVEVQSGVAKAPRPRRENSRQ
jgi:hypothetical protein